MIRTSITIALWALLTYLSMFGTASPLRELAEKDNIIPLSDISIPITHSAVPFTADTILRRATSTGLVTPDTSFSYSIPMTLAGQTVNLFIDTGSSNLWVVTDDYQCINEDGSASTRSQCNFGGPGFSVHKATGKNMTNTFFNTGYADGEYLIGYGWNATAKLGQMTLPGQLFGVVNKAHWNGDGYNSGLIGLGSLYTNQIYQYDRTHTTPEDNDRVIFPNPVTLAWQQGASQYHTLAFDRVPHDATHVGRQPAGQLVLGGRPSNVAVTNAQVTVPLISWQVGGPSGLMPEQAWSAPDVKITFKFPGSNAINQTAVYANIDSGAPGVYMPTPVWNAWSSQIKSSACDGSGLPALSTIWNGVEIAFDKRDLLAYDGNGGCYVNAADAGPNSAGLGPNFMKNVVLTWDKSKQQLTIFQRKAY